MSVAFSFIIRQPNHLNLISSALQLNLIRSHAAGVGNPLSIERVRMLFALRINVLAKGYSGITVDTLQSAILAFNNSCLPVVPEKGTVGASGDLAPLSHIALGLLGEGQMWSPRTGLTDASSVLKEYGLQPIRLKPKEGLALINGTQFIAALGAEALGIVPYMKPGVSFGAAPPFGAELLFAFFAFAIFGFAFRFCLFFFRSFRYLLFSVRI